MVEDILILTVKIYNYIFHYYSWIAPFGTFQVAQVLTGITRKILQKPEYNVSDF